jgi:NAD(P)-dependent dehydrogenase (short-subunit alcohol dehydrogenase family)
VTASDSFQDQVIAITGSGAGLGRAYANYLAARGATLVLNDIDPTAADETARIVRSLGAEVLAVPGSVADAEVCENVVASAVHRFGRLDALVNNAGIDASGSVAEVGEAHIQATIDTHLLAAIWTTRAALPVMTRQGGGRVVMTTSAAGAFGLQQHPISSAADAAVIGLTRALALDAATTGVRINAIAPIADTALADSFFRQFPHLHRHRYPPELVAPIVGYLCHRDCTLQGAVLTAGGGRIARIASFTGPGVFAPAPALSEVSHKLERIVSLAHPVELRSALDEFLMIEV